MANPTLFSAAFQEKLVSIGRDAIARIHRRLIEVRSKNSGLSELEDLYDKKKRPTDTSFRDFITESTAIECLSNPNTNHYATQMKIIGEELMKDEQQWSGYENIDDAFKIIALIDPVDGTKLEKRDIPNWCTAIIFYERETGKPMVSLVGQATGTLYYATSTACVFSSRKGKTIKGKCFKQTPNAMEPLKNGWLSLQPPEPLRVRDLGVTATPKHLAFVAQSPADFLHMAQHPKLFEPFGRIYNLGGNPMIAKIADGTIDAAIGLGHVKGNKNTPQKAHDVIPGAFIAHQAGACVLDLEGNPIDWKKGLLKPDIGTQFYVAARTKELAQECLSRINRDALNIEKEKATKK